MKKSNLNLDALTPVFTTIAGLTRTQRILICVATVVLIAAVFGYFLYKPKIEDMAALNEDITRAEQKLATTKRNAAEYDKYREMMDDAQARFAVISQELPATEEIPSLLTSISQAGSASGLRFLLFQPQSESRKDFYAEIPVRMELSGSYHELGNFFDRLARLSRIVNIDNCSTRRQNEALDISCTAVTYRFIGEQASDN